MKQRILAHTSFMVVLTVLLTFFSACGVMYSRFSSNMKEGVRGEAEYIQAGIEEMGESYLEDTVSEVTSNRVTLLDANGDVLYDNEVDPETMGNHKNRPEFIQALKNGTGEKVRFSTTLSKQTYNYAVKLSDGTVLRVTKTTDSLFHTLLSSFTLLGLLVVCFILAEFYLAQKQTRQLIEPINALDLEHPLRNVCYEELRPLLVRVDEQNRQITAQMEELKNAQAMRQEFSANVSHELKTPLMSISGYAELMMNGMVPAEKVADFSGRIYREATRLGNLVSDIIQLSRLDEGESSLSYETVDLMDLAQDVRSNLRSQAEKKKLHLTFSGEHCSINGVRQVLYEMMYNIADNAVRYTEAGGEVSIQVGKQGKKIFYRVTDTGIGIPKEEQSRIFERFYRVDKSHSRATGGTGLGLSIVKHGALLHHAKVKVDSEPGRGTTMEILFGK